MHQASGSLQSPTRNGKSLSDTVTLATHGHHAWSPSRSGSLPPLAAVAVPPTNSSSASLPVASPRTPRPTAYVFGSHLPPTPTTVYNESTLTYRPVERPQSLSRGSSSSSLDVLKGAARQERRSSLSLSNLTIREMQDKESPQNGYEAERYGSGFASQSQLRDSPASAPSNYPGSHSREYSTSSQSIYSPSIHDSPGLASSSTGSQQRPSVSSIVSSSARPSIDDRRGSSFSGREGSIIMPTGGGSSPGPGGWSTDREGGQVPVAFDEGVLRQLCDLDCALPLLTERIKQSLASCKQVSMFFKARARAEEAYARSLGEMGRELHDNYSRSEGKAGSFVKAYMDTLRIHDNVAQQRIKFSTRLNEMGDDLANLAKEMEKTRKQHKDTGARYERMLQDADVALEKAKGRFDSTVEELERILILKEGGSLKDAGMHNESNGRLKLGKAIGKGATGLFKGKNPAQMQRQEDETRQRMSATSDAFRKAVLEAQSVRQEYFQSQLPKILRLLKACADEVDFGTQYHLNRYAHLYESALLQEGTTIAPIEEGATGLKSVAEAIDNRTDFKSFMQNFVVARGGGGPRGPRREGLYEDGYQPSLLPHVMQSQDAAVSNGVLAPSPLPAGKHVFGYPLDEAMLRDGDEVPKILEVCAEAIEKRGLTAVGIYRLSGMTSAVQKLKAAFDRDVASVNLDSDEYVDINVVASTLKLYFRELPDPLFTYGLYNEFMDAARTENDRLRHIRLHEQVNELPDANYAALKFFMSHLHKVLAHEKINQMSASNLSIVFGPTLFRQPPEGGGGEGLGLADLMSLQCRAVETILLQYEAIFV